MAQSSPLCLSLTWRRAEIPQVIVVDLHDEIAEASPPQTGPAPREFVFGSAHRSRRIERAIHKAPGWLTGRCVDMERAHRLSSSSSTIDLDHRHSGNREQPQNGSVVSRLILRTRLPRQVRRCSFSASSARSSTHSSSTQPLQSSQASSQSSAAITASSPAERTAPAAVAPAQGPELPRYLHAAHAFALTLKEVGLFAPLAFDEGNSFR